MQHGATVAVRGGGLDGAGGCYSMLELRRDVADSPLVERPRVLRVAPFVAALLAACSEPSTERGATTDVIEPWFIEVTQGSGLDFVHETGATGELWLPEVMGAGVALFDADEDGLLDLYFVNSGTGLAGRAPSDAAVNRLYRQTSGGRSFTDITAESGLGDAGYGMGVALGDIDNDGRVDVYVTNLGADQLYRNRGGGTFERITERANVNVPGWSCSAAFFDFNRDGALDLFVTQYVHFDVSKRCHDASGRHLYCSPHAYRPVPDVLLVNQGDGTFRDHSAAAGIAAVAGSGLGVVVEDFDGDGWPDVYVANDGNPNHLWLNRRDGTFEESALPWGVACNLYGRAEAGMGVVAADLSGAGLPDLFSTHLENESNTLYRHRGSGVGFDDVTPVSGLGFASMPRTGFGVVALDATLVGRLDLFIVNGRVVAGKPLPGVTPAPPWDAYAEPNLYFRNLGDGRFLLAGEEVAALCEPLDVSRGSVAGDLDGDGRLDVVIANLAGPPRIYLNRAPREGRWSVVNAVDPRLRRAALGARVSVHVDGRSYTRTIHHNSGYLSAGDARAHFGLGPCEAIEFVEVRWPDGLRERFRGVAPDTVVELLRGAGEPQP